MLSLQDLDILSKRILKRHLEGWYDIPDAKIKSRMEEVVNYSIKLREISDIYIDINSSILSRVEKKEKKMYKLIVLDCDGTLLNSSKKITERTIAALKSVLNRNVKIMIASARPFYRLKPILSQLELVRDDQYTIAFNGALVVNNTECEVLFSASFNDEQIKELIGIGDSFSTKMFLYSKDAIYSNMDDEKYRLKNPDVNFNVVSLQDLDYSRIAIYKIAYVNTPEETEKLKARLPQYIFEKYEISSSVPQFVEIVNKGVTKAGALALIEKRIGIKSSEILAFGDCDNGITMLKYAGGSVVMGNASDNIKSYATYVTTSNDEDGVAVAIEHFWEM